MSTEHKQSCPCFGSASLQPLTWNHCTTWSTLPLSPGLNEPVAWTQSGPRLPLWRDGIWLFVRRESLVFLPVTWIINLQHEFLAGVWKDEHPFRVPLRRVFRWLGTPLLTWRACWPPWKCRTTELRGWSAFLEVLTKTGVKVREKSYHIWSYFIKF